MNICFSFRELTCIARMGLPILLAQFAQVGMNFMDTLMAGRYSARDLAGVGVASSVWWPVIMLAVGILLALPAMSAQLVGARRPGRSAHLLRQGMLLTCLLSLCVMAVLFAVSCRMELFGIDREIVPVARDYLCALLPGVLPFLLFINLRSFLEGFGRTRPAMVISALCLILNVPCNYICIYGHLGMPEMGGAGCGVATTICFWFRFLAIWCYLRRDRELSRYSMLPGVRAKAGKKTPGLREPLVDLPVIASVARIGFPNAVALSLETMLFSLTAMLLAPLGATVVAAHQITMSWENLAFSVPLAVNMTAAIRVGHCLGAGNLEEARVAAWTAVILGVCTALGCLTTTIALSGHIAGLYTTDPEVLALAVQTLVLSGLLQPGDSLQGITAGILRGYNDTSFISRVCLAVCTLPGLGLGFILARTDWIVPAMGARGFWTAYIVAMSLCAVCYLVRITWLHRQPLDAIRARLAR